MRYSAKVLDYFHHPRCAGEVPSGAAGEASNPVCGDVVRLTLSAQSGRVTAAAFQAAGCVPAIACASWLAERVAGRPLEEIRALLAADIEAGLDGLPPAGRHASELALEALVRALGKL